MDDGSDNLDVHGLQCGILTKIIKAIEKNVKVGDIIPPIIKKGLNLPLTPISVPAYLLLNPEEVGIVNKDFPIYQHNNYHPDFSLSEIIDTLSNPIGEEQIKADPCE